MRRPTLSNGSWWKSIAHCKIDVVVSRINRLLRLGKRATFHMDKSILITYAETSTHLQFVAHYLAEVCFIVVEIVNNVDDILCILLTNSIWAIQKNFPLLLWCHFSLHVWSSGAGSSWPTESVISIGFWLWSILICSWSFSKQSTQDSWDAIWTTLWLYPYCYG